MSLGGRFEAASIIPETRRQAFSIRVRGSNKGGVELGALCVPVNTRVAWAVLKLDR